MSDAVTVHEIKQFLIDALNLEDTRPEDIADAGPLFGTGLGLDSIDGLELHLALGKKYRIPMDDSKGADRSYLASPEALAAFVNARLSA